MHDVLRRKLSSGRIVEFEAVSSSSPGDVTIETRYLGPVRPTAVEVLEAEKFCDEIMRGLGFKRDSVEEGLHLRLAEGFPNN